MLAWRVFLAGYLCGLFFQLFANQIIKDNVSCCCCLYHFNCDTPPQKQIAQPLTKSTRAHSVHQVGSLLGSTSHAFRLGTRSRSHDLSTWCAGHACTVAPKTARRLHCQQQYCERTSSVQLLSQQERLFRVQSIAARLFSSAAPAATCGTRTFRVMRNLFYLTVAVRAEAPTASMKLER